MNGEWNEDGTRYERSGARGAFVWSARLVRETARENPGWYVYRDDRWSTVGEMIHTPAESRSEAVAWLREFVGRYERTVVEPRLARARRRK